MEIEITKKPKVEVENQIKIKTPEDVYKLNVVQSIKDAIQEHLLLLGLDKGNNLRNINLVGVGNSEIVSANSKEILKTVLISANDRVILVHNHPSNTLEASNRDIDFTNKINKFLSIFNIQLLDHIIVAEQGYVSMMQERQINKNYTNNDMKFVEEIILIEENNRLKQENAKLKIREEKYMNKYESVIIMKPTLTADELKLELNKYKEMFEKLSNKPVEVEDKGKKKLAYEIQGNKEGNYAIFSFYGKTEDIGDIERLYRIDDNVMKFITVKLDMEAEETPEVEDDMEME